MARPGTRLTSWKFEERRLLRDISEQCQLGNVTTPASAALVEEIAEKAALAGG